MRDRETIDSELRMLAAELRSIRELGGKPSTRLLDELLDERLGHRVAPAENPTFPVPQGRRATKPTTSLRAGTGALRRFGLLAALPISLVATVTVLVAMFAVRHAHPAEHPTVVTPSSARPEPPPSSAQPAPVAPKLNAPPPGQPSTDAIVDRALIDALKQVGVPVPSPEYATKQGRAVCDFLAHQPNFAEAVRFVQQSTIWDANQSAELATAATVSYCPQYEPASMDQMQKSFQDALSSLQAIQGDLQGIQDHLPALPGHP